MGTDADSMDIDPGDVTGMAAGLERDSQRFGEAAGPLRESLTSETDGGAAWVSANLIGAGDFLSLHTSAKRSADSLLDIVTQDIAGMGRIAQDVMDGLTGQDVDNGTEVDRTVPGGGE